MFPVILMVASALVLECGVVVAVQNSEPQVQTEAAEIGAPDGCGSLVASSAASPSLSLSEATQIAEAVELAEIAETVAIAWCIIGRA